MDTENIRMAEWLQMLRCPVDLSPQDMQRLNTPNMISVWRHLQRHIKPLRGVQTVRQNLLLSTLHNNQIPRGKFGNFKIYSSQEFSQLRNITDSQGEINNLKQKIKATDADLETASLSLLKNIHDKELLRHKLNEKEDKAVLFNLYRSNIQKDIEKINMEIENTRGLKILQHPVSSNDVKLQRSIVFNYVKKSIVTTSEAINNDALNDMIVSTLQFPATSIYEGIIQVSHVALRTLNNIRANLDISSTLKLKEDLTVHQSYLFAKHLNILNALVFQNELNISNCLDKIREQSFKLEKKKLLLKSVMEEFFVHNCVEVENEDLSVNQLINSFVTNTIHQKQFLKLRSLLEELKLECSDYEYLKVLVKKLGDEEGTSFEEVKKKVNDVNKIISLYSHSKFETVKTTVLKTCSEEVSTFFYKLKIQNEDLESLFLSYKNIVGKECELLQNKPLSAVLRTWEEPCELPSSTLIQDLSKNSLLLSLHVQSQVQNTLKNVLEKICWSKVSQEYL